MVKALSELAAQLHDLLRPMHVPTRLHDGADLAEVEVIQRAAEDCLRRMLSQPASQLGAQALYDLVLPQQDIDRMRARMTPKGRKRERETQGSPREQQAQQGCSDEHH
ncbi:uncharacterized protein NFIA_087910 [Aspergillus fischeri NRRL 181]|uniref:Uncharacterized protein n=1 Tax=Neosartorya fischeri (strain ATCC 1020 / DSM 3700 / CBS 544.65 / FGSC A1164 / JCM 1740 / NRRL 181 / WB 181) TaxID=331117 RepID=A1DHH8_NEOFI|nr:uncharacterized protein NFIA_087910 [Aspergillus fischeri NRRL 181]EAW18835.1 hypothetical protein NFIA_087910 [Aspergillus fischeri NRRL 181]KAG2012377.1 hypothetical protein GB937_007207 [Aspergillus fischeri]